MLRLRPCWCTTYNLDSRLRFDCGGDGGKTVVINSFASEHDLDGAMQWFNKIYEAGLAPSLITYSTIFKVCSSARRGDMALTLFKQMLEKDAITPNLVTINHALQVRPQPTPATHPPLHPSPSFHHTATASPTNTTKLTHATSCRSCRPSRATAST